MDCTTAGPVAVELQHTGWRVAVEVVRGQGTRRAAPGPTTRCGMEDVTTTGAWSVPLGCEGAGGPGTTKRQLTSKQLVIDEQRS